MGRYDVGKESEESSEPIPNQPKNPNVEPLEVKFVFNAEDAEWNIKIKKENRADWETVKRLTNGYKETVSFFSVNEAQEWCEKIGLL